MLTCLMVFVLAVTEPSKKKLPFRKRILIMRARRFPVMMLSMDNANVRFVQKAGQRRDLA